MVNCVTNETSKNFFVSSKKFLSTIMDFVAQFGLC